MHDADYIRNFEINKLQWKVGKSYYTWFDFVLILNFSTIGQRFWTFLGTRT